jgi:hypothetical protein
MIPWTTKVMAEQKLMDLRAERSRAGLRYRAGYGGSEAPRARRSTRRWQRMSEWAGYRIIGIGCRLARPAVVARVQAEL